MKLRKIGSLVGLLSLSLMAPACGDDDGADATDNTDTDESDSSDEDAGDSDETTTDESDESDSTTDTEDDADSSDTTAAADASDEPEGDASGNTSDEPEGDASGASDAGNTSDDEGDAAGGGDEPDADTEADAGDDEPPPAPTDCNYEEFDFAPAEITADTVWDCTSTHVLPMGQLTVVANATLTIKPGTKIIGDSGSGLVITSTGKIDANGQVNAPILFTSSKGEGERAPSDWGGILLLGKAPINAEGGTAEAEGVPTTEGYAEFGGEDEEHDCGSMSYVKIQFSGFEVSPDNELNGLGVAGCGSATELHHIQAHKGSDDGFEFWGGSPVVHHLVSSQNEDDLFDWTDGFKSNVQFLVLQNPTDTGIEGDNSEANYGLTPRTQPQISNMTLVGGANIGMLQRRGSWANVTNSIFLGNSVSAVDLRDTETLDGTEDGSLTISNSIFFDNGETSQFADDPNLDNAFDEEAYFSEEEFANKFDVDPNLVDPTNPTEPNYMPDGDAVLDGAVNPPAGMFDTTAKYIGAFEPGGEDWTAGWTEYPQD